MCPRNKIYYIKTGILYIMILRTLQLKNWLMRLISSFSAKTNRNGFVLENFFKGLPKNGGIVVTYSILLCLKIIKVFSVYSFDT